MTTCHRTYAIIVLAAATPAIAGPARTDDAQTILKATGVSGGIVVHLGCGDGRLTAALHAGEAYTVHGLAGDAARVTAARRHVASLGLCGKVAIEHWSSRTLPYADNLVNLLVADGLGDVAMTEVLRVLVPGGVAWVGGKKTVKPWPKEMDEWPHFLHDAGNNAVAADSVVGPPKRLHWLGAPLWLRSHETASGIQGQVAAGGRLFYIFDEGPIGITDERLPDRWAICCRDAFNGKLLWKRPLPHWGWRQWARSRFEGKDWTRLRAARVSAPDEMQRRLVADARHVYTTLGYQAPLSILDAATGKLLTTVKGTAPTGELLLSRGVVLAHVKAGPSDAGHRKGKSKGPAGTSALVAVKADTGKVLWRHRAGAPIPGLLLAADGGKAFYIAGRDLVAVDLASGKRLWRAACKTRPRTVVAADGAVVLLGATSLDAVDAASGKLRWSRKVPPRSGAEAVDLFVIDGLAWPGMIPVDARGKPTRKSDGALALGYDLRSGEQKRRVLVRNFRSPEHHHRCYRNKATTGYIISGMEGAEFLDLTGNGHQQNNWFRGACRYGIMPCYGLLYVPPDQCFCQPGGKLLGYAALAPKADRPLTPVADEKRLVKGPAYAGASSSGGAGTSEGDWPTYRHDPARHGSTSARVSAKLSRAWQARLGGRLTQPVVAADKCFVARIDAHTVHALDLGSGKELWRFTAGGRIDSPPTVYRGLVLFGSADGRAYCLRAADGRMAWSFLAAPTDRRIAAFGQVESAWPVHGSVLVRNQVAYFAAGRSTYLDGGIRLWGVEPATGNVVHKGLLAGPHRQIDGKRDVAFYVPGANSDVLVSEGGHLYMRQKRLTPQLKEVKPNVLSSKGEADIGLHVFSTAGLLDGSWYNRTFWMYSKRWPGFQLGNQAPKSGQLLVVDGQATYAVKVFYRRNVHSPMFFPGKEGYLLYADKNTTEPQIVGEAGARTPVRWLPQSDYSRGRGNQMRKLDSHAFGDDKMIGYTRAETLLWKVWLPVRIRAMAKARDVLFVAGPPDMYDAKDPFAPFEARRGARLLAVSPEDGRKISDITLRVPPVFDGLIACEGRLLVSLRDGSVACFAGDAR